MTDQQADDILAALQDIAASLRTIATRTMSPPMVLTERGTIEAVPTWDAWKRRTMQVAESGAFRFPKEA